MSTACNSENAPQPHEIFSGTQNIKLAEAVQNGNNEQVRVLAGQGADVNAISDEAGHSLLIWALLNRQPDAMRTLLELGADPTLHTKQGTTVVHYAAILADSPEYLRVLLDNGAPADIVDTRTGETPLFEALRPAASEQAAMLMEAGADVNHSRGLGNTVLHVAAAVGTAGIVLELLERGADPQAVNSQGFTFQQALASGPPESVYTNEGQKEREKIRQWLRGHDVEVKF